MAESQHTGALKASLHSCGSTPRRNLPPPRTTTYSGRQEPESRVISINYIVNGLGVLTIEELLYVELRASGLFKKSLYVAEEMAVSDEGLPCFRAPHLL